MEDKFAAQEMMRWWMHTLLCSVFLGVHRASSSFLGGEYPKFTAPTPRITPPTSSVCIVTALEWGAAGDGVQDDTQAIRKAIADCPRSPADGTFQVVLPAGKSFLTGALNLSSGIELVVNG